MKILVINGSPKGDRSDCMHMTRAFLAGMNVLSTAASEKRIAEGRNIWSISSCNWAA